MSIIDYLQQGGKASAKDIITGLANILGIQLEEMAQLWEAGVQKYGSEEALSDALDTAVEGIEDPQSPEFKDAVASVFAEEIELYKQGGKLDQLVNRFAKGGNIDCGCGGKKLKCGGKPKKKEEGGIVKAQEGIALTRRQARDLAKLNRGFNNQQFGVGYTNAKAMLRNNTDLKGKELRNKARLIVSGVKETPAPVIVETPKAIETPALTAPKEIVIKSLVKPQKSDEQLAMEVLRGLHGNGAARRASLGDRADAVQAIVNRTIASQRPLTSYGGEIAPSIVVAERTTRGPRLKWKDSEGYHVVNSTPKIVEAGRDEDGRWYTVSNGRHGYDENGNYYVAEDLPGTMSRDEAMERASNLYAVPLYDKCGGKVEKHQQTNGKGRGKLDTSIWNRISKSREPAYSWNSSIAARLKNAITDKLGITQKPKGEPTFAESAEGQVLRKGLDSQVAHFMPGLSVISYGRDAINHIKAVDDNMLNLAAVPLDVAGAVGINLPLLKGMNIVKLGSKPITIYSDYGSSTVTPQELSESEDLIGIATAIGQRFTTPKNKK